MLRVLLLEHAVAASAGEEHLLDALLLDRIDVALHLLHDVIVAHSDARQHRAAARLVEDRVVLSQLLQDGDRRLGDLGVAVGGGAAGEIAYPGAAGLLSQRLRHRTGLAVGVPVRQHAVRHLAVARQHMSRFHEVLARPLHHVHDLDLGRAPPLAVLARGALVQRLHHRIVGGNVFRQQAVGEDDATPCHAGVPSDPFERGAYALAEPAHGAGHHVLLGELEIGCFDVICHFNPPGEW